MSTVTKTLDGWHVSVGSESSQADTLTGYEKINYEEAWQELSSGRDIFDFEGNKLFVIPTPNSFDKSKHNPSEKMFLRKQKPAYEVLGLKDGWFEVEVFGLKTYQTYGTDTYDLYDDGEVLNDCAETVGYVAFSGDFSSATIKVTIEPDGTIVYEQTVREDSD